MRPIKFRAWDKENEVMVYPKGILFDGRVVNFSCGILEPFEGCELMQFTGLKDKNGKEIYEGDIVNLTHMVYAGYGNVDEVTEAVVIEDITKLPFGPSTITCEVIGNIYENPELLEGEK